MKDWAHAARWSYDTATHRLKSLDNNDALVGRDGDYFYCNGQNVVELEVVEKA